MADNSLQNKVGTLLVQATATVRGTVQGGTVPGNSGAVATLAGFIGEQMGTLRAGTNGNAYSFRSSTVLTTSYAAVINPSITPGIYLVSGKVSCSLSSGTSNIYVKIGVGGTDVTTESYGQASNTIFGCANVTAVVQITTTTTLQLTAKLDLATGGTGNHELFVTRIG